MKQARRKSLWNPIGIPWFKGQVQDGGPWDYKTQDTRHKTQGAQYKAFGNFNHGATGTAAFTRASLSFGRQVGHSVNHPSSPQFGGAPGSLPSIFPNPFGGMTPYGDDPHDRQMIQQGIQYAGTDVVAHEAGNENAMRGILMLAASECRLQGATVQL